MSEKQNNVKSRDRIAFEHATQFIRAVVSSTVANEGSVGVAVALGAVAQVFCDLVGILHQKVSKKMAAEYLEAVAGALEEVGVKATFELIEKDGGAGECSGCGTAKS